MALITVLIITYNNEKYIGAAIESILHQSINDLDILVINDSSTDRTIDIIKSYDDPRIRIISNTKNEGILYSRNRALKEVNSEFLAIMDGDDISYPTRLETQLQYFKTDPELALIGSYADEINRSGELTGQQIKGETDSDLISLKLLFENQFVHSSIMLRTKIFKEFEGYKTSLAEDYDLFLRISRKYKMMNINKCLIQYRTHEEGISKARLSDLEFFLLGIKSEILRELGLPNTLSHQRMISIPFIWKDINTHCYKSFYSQILNLHFSKEDKKYLEAKKYIFSLWYQVIMSNGGVKSLSLLFNKEFFDWRYVTNKHIRKTFKNSIKNIIQ